MDKEELIRRFVVKRSLFRKISGISLAGMAIYALTAQHLFSAEIAGSYSRIYNSTMAIWIVINIVISKYIGWYLSTCPVCHVHIPTSKAKRSDKLVTGNGPLPDYCPWCGTAFYRYK